jgi:hypothetical protein
LVAAYRREHAGDEPDMTANERQRLRQLEREACELQRPVLERPVGGEHRDPRGDVVVVPLGDALEERPQVAIRMPRVVLDSVFCLR